MSYIYHDLPCLQTRVFNWGHLENWKSTAPLRLR